jgi:hypothetical protein
VGGTTWVRIPAGVQPRPGRITPAVGQDVAGCQIELRPSFRSNTLGANEICLPRRNRQATCDHLLKAADSLWAAEVP